MPEFTFHFPPASYSDWLPIVLLTIIAGSFAIYRIMPTPEEKRDPLMILQENLGLTKLPVTVVMLGAAMWGLLLIALVGGLMWTIVDALLHMTPATSEEQTELRGILVTLTAMTATLGAVVAFPVTLVRIQHSAKQNDLTDERLFNDKLNDASQNLAAWREVTKVVGHGKEQRVLTTREPDLVTRATAIDRLFGLIRERPEEASRIAAMLSLYVREHTVQVGDKIPDVPAEPTPENASPDELSDWADGLAPKRSDLQKAVQAIGRIRDLPNVELEDTAIDLRGANLQGMDLSGLNFGKGKWRNARLQGAHLNKTKLQESDLSWAHLQGAELDGAKLQGANLTSANMQRADLSFAQLQQADLRFVKSQEAHLGFAQLEKANLSGANMQESSLSWANLQGADLMEANLQGAHLEETQLQGAFLYITKLNGAHLYGAEFDTLTFVSDAIVNGASVTSIDIENLPQFAEHLASIFGDGTNTVTPWPEHWPKDELSYDEFNRAWRDWVAEHHPDVLEYLPDYARNAK